MAKSTSSNPNSSTTLGSPRHPRHWIVFVACLLLGLLIGVALLDYSPEQSRMISSKMPQRNLVGIVGAEGSFWSFNYIGLSTWLLPIFLLWMAISAIRNARLLPITRFVAMLVTIVSGSSLATMFDTRPSDYFPCGLGGALGKGFYESFLLDILGPFGSGIILLLLYALSLTFIFTKDILAEFEKIAASFTAWRERRAIARSEQAEMARQLREQKARERAAMKRNKGESLGSTSLFPPTSTSPRTASDPGQTLDDDDLPPLDEPDEEDLDDDERPLGGKPTPPPRIIRGTTAAANSNGGNAKPITPPAPPSPKEDPIEPPPPGALAIVKPEETKKAKATAIPFVEANYEFPPVTLLNEPPKLDNENTDAEYTANMADLVRILGEFSVTVTPGEIHVGPVITCYEVVPAPGVRVEKIANLDKNIALGMRAQSVRILAPIPGKAAVGIEMPNRVPSPVGMRDILESEDWVNAKAEIPIALGKDVSGRPLISDLTRMPHLLIAGATGSGKSVCINSIIASIVYRKSPKDVRLIMVDPKVVELKIFNTLPHMLIPVVTEPKKVPSALKWLLGEMEKRYKMFGKVGVRNISGFNHRKKAAEPEFPIEQSSALDPNGAEPTQATLEGIEDADDLGPIPERIPYIVIIIDELADLMMVAAAEIETSVARLAQLARAAGIHIIIATQRPSVNVITGIIKANLPSRIAFQVASQVDSRTIIDGKGADMLIGRGDMLFTPPGTSRLVRAQGAYVSDEEVQSVVEYLKRNGPPQYAQEVQEQIDYDPDAEDEESDDYGDLSEDEILYKKALEIIKTTRRASTSTLQRRLRIGYNRAARIMDQMEDNGIVGPENGSSPRNILIDFDSM